MPAKPSLWERFVAWWQRPSAREREAIELLETYDREHGAPARARQRAEARVDVEALTEALDDAQVFRPERAAHHAALRRMLAAARERARAV